MAKRSAATARELAARALCSHDKNPADSTFLGKPMWMDYLPAADAVLAAIGWEETEDGARPKGLARGKRP